MIKIGIIAATAALLFPTVSISHASHVRGTIHVQATVEDVRIADNGPTGWSTGDLRSEYLLIWNKAITSRPIGHAYMSCIFLGKGGNFHSGFSSCALNMFLPRGKLRMGGTIRSERRFWMPITGGTGIYEGAGGTAFSVRIGVNVRNLTLQVT